MLWRRQLELLSLAFGTQLRIKIKHWYLPSYISNLGFGRPVINKDSGNISNAVRTYRLGLQNNRSQASERAFCKLFLLPIWRQRSPFLSLWCIMTKSYEKSYHKERAKQDASIRKKVEEKASENSLLDYLWSSGRPSATIIQISLSHAIIQYEKSY